MEKILTRMQAEKPASASAADRIQRSRLLLQVQPLLYSQRPRYRVGERPFQRAMGPSNLTMFLKAPYVSLIYDNAVLRYTGLAYRPQVIEKVVAEYKGCGGCRTS
jgi:hypothetical protein